MLSKQLDSMWIIDKNGICLMQRIFDKEKNIATDETMFSGFISALNSFASNVIGDTIERITLGSKAIFIKSFGSFFIVISLNVNNSKINEKKLFTAFDELGKQFSEKYGSFLDNNNTIFSLDLFEPFGETVDAIFGIKTIKVLQEHHKLLDLLKKAEKELWDEQTSANNILSFYESLDEYKRNIILPTTIPILKLFKDSKAIPNEQKKKFKELYKEANKLKNELS